MLSIRQNIFTIGASLAFIAISCYLSLNDMGVLSLAPVALLAVFFAVYFTEYTFLALAFLTPLSINIEEWTNSFGLYVPTEPILFGLMVYLLMMQVKSNIIPKYVWKNPIVWAVLFYLFWIFITSITSSNPVTSFKFLLSKLWFIIPLLFFAPKVFEKRRNIRWFLWLFSIAMIIAISYTLMVHASYGFGEKESHWVMWPFFKDHTIYGALVAFITPLIFGIYLSKKHSALIQLVLIGLISIVLIGLFFSYTRAAWLSIIASIMVWGAIRFKIKFSWLASAAVIVGLIVWFSWDNIQMELERNKFEHTTEEFGERLQSATNVTTDASNLERLNRWSCAIEMFKERPVFGFGPGTYSFEYARFQEPENLTIISTNFGNMGNAHSEYLGPLSESGLLGMISVLLFVAAIFYKGITLYIKWPHEDKEMRVFLMVMIMSLVTYFVHGVLNNYLDTDKASVPIWTICAIFIAQEAMLKLNEQPTEKDSNK